MCKEYTRQALSVEYSVGHGDQRCTGDGHKLKQRKFPQNSRKHFFHCRGNWILTQVAHRNGGISLPRNIHKPVWTWTLATASQQLYLSREVAPRYAHLEMTSRGPFHHQPFRDLGKYSLIFPVIISLMRCDISSGFSSWTEIVMDMPLFCITPFSLGFSVTTSLITLRDGLTTDNRF